MPQYYEKKPAEQHDLEAPCCVNVGGDLCCATLLVLFIDPRHLLVRDYGGGCLSGLTRMEWNEWERFEVWCCKLH